MPWANGLGVTAEIAVWPAGVADWTWRLSIADISEDGPFSVLNGIDRHIMVIDGVGMNLTVGRQPIRAVRRGADPLAFSGDEATMCRLIDGPIADLNLMVRRSYASGALTVFRLTDGQLLTDNDLVGGYPAVALVLVSGSLTGPSLRLDAHDALLLDVGALLPDLRANGPTVVAVATVALR